MFRATARLRAPEGVEADDVRKALERLAGEIMVDLTFGDDSA
jgi:glycine cleavage system regulatory protein